MKPTNFAPAKYVDCDYITDMGGYAHEMLDHCYDCAPFWARIPLCPTDNRKLTTHGFCRTCSKHYNLVDVEDDKKHPATYVDTSKADSKSLGVIALLV